MSEIILWLQSNPALGVYIFINITAFVLYAYDKIKALKSGWRISESTLICWAVLGGGVGALVAMLFFRHKIRKPKFFILVPIGMLISLFLLALILGHIINFGAY